MLYTKRKYKKSSINVNEIYFINSENEKITVFSPSDIILKEFKKLGIQTKEATLDELLFQLSSIIFDEYISKIEDDENYDIIEFKTTDLYKTISVLYYHVKEVSYYLYDYDERKMPAKIRNSYKNKIDPTINLNK